MHAHMETMQPTTLNPVAPDTGAGQQASTHPDKAPMAVIVLTVQRDLITQTAHLVMGGMHTATRQWKRLGPGSWSSKDPEWMAHEDRIGVELAEYMDMLSLPSRIAAMLPHLPCNSDAAAAAAREVANG